MSEITRISPILDDFDIGSSISEHNGVTCYPAMRMHSDDKYIVKTISIPASQTQLDALLLTGAFPDATAALTYFKDMADRTVDELEVLKRLSNLEGFLAHEQWQIAAMSDGIGFNVYTLSTYKQTLRKYLQRQPLTHLGAVNLGLDICSALAVCRRLGYLFVDLKPNNIYLVGDQQFKIGDIGFISLDSLAYATLPDRYRSEYTAPEAQDAFAELNSTIDIYALGLILYQAYNGGALPSQDEIVDGKFAAPAYADYEMAEIIQKACDVDPTARWQDPVQMGQALVSYMQRNGANDTPIMPPVIPIVSTEDLDLSGIDLTDASPVDEDNALSLTDETISDDAVNDASTEGPTPEDALSENGLESEAAEETPELITAETDIAENAADITENEETLTDTPAADETSPEHNISDVEYDEISDDLNEMLTQADELVAHPVPDPVVAPEPIEVQIPAAETTEGESDETLNAVTEEVSEAAEADEDAEGNLAETAVVSVPQKDVSDPVDEAAVVDETETDNPVKMKNTVTTWILNAVLILLIIAIIAVGFFYYKNIYLLPIDAVNVTGDETSVVVYIDSSIDESLLSVVCSDSHGNQISAPVVNGTSTFANLAPDTVYNIQILVDGFHRLTGETAVSYSTPPQTNIVQFLAVTGSEDGSAIVRFTDDPTSDCVWTLTYSAEGEEPATVEVLSHFATIAGLSIGKEYTLSLAPAEDMYVTGQTEIKFTASELVFAQDVAVVSCIGKELVVCWNAPDGVIVTEWAVRCYNDDIGYNETTITADTTATFTVPDPAESYFVDVTAAGMSLSQPAYMPKNAITITDFTYSTTSDNKMLLNWETNQGVPEDGWLLMYTIEDSGIQSTVTCTDNSAVISPVVPDATYSFTLQRANGDSVLTAPLVYTSPKAQDFSGYGMIRSSMTYKLCKRPDAEDWKYTDLSDSDYTNTFKVGENISIVGQLHDTYGISDDNIVMMYVFRNAEGNVISYCYNDAIWDDMWSKSYGEFDVPATPTAAGEYTMSIYFNGKLVSNKKVIIEE